MHDEMDATYWREPDFGINAGSGDFKRAAMPDDSYMEVEAIPVVCPQQSRRHEAMDSRRAARRHLGLGYRQGWQGHSLPVRRSIHSSRG